MQSPFYKVYAFLFAYAVAPLSLQGSCSQIDPLDLPGLGCLFPDVCDWSTLPEAWVRAHLNLYPETVKLKICAVGRTDAAVRAVPRACVVAWCVRCGNPATCLRQLFDCDYNDILRSQPLVAGIAQGKVPETWSFAASLPHPNVFVVPWKISGVARGGKYPVEYDSLYGGTGLAPYFEAIRGGAAPYKRVPSKHACDANARA